MITKESKIVPNILNSRKLHTQKKRNQQYLPAVGDPVTHIACHLTLPKAPSRLDVGLRNGTYG